MTKKMGHAFTGLEKLLWETFLPRLFFCKSKYIPPIVGTLSTIPVKRSGLDLPKPVISANERFLSSQRASMELILAVMGGNEFSTSDHLQAFKEENTEVKKSGMASMMSNYRKLLRNSPPYIVAYYSAPKRRVPC